MGLLDTIEAALAGGNPDQHFDQVVEQSSPNDLAPGVAAALRSDQTPPFGDMVGQLFGQSDSNQRAGMLNSLLRTLGPAALSSIAGGALGRVLGGQSHVTVEQANQISPDEAAQIAAHAERAQPNVVDDVSAFYAQHATLLKTLGGTALMIALAKMKQNQQYR